MDTINRYVRVDRKEMAYLKFIFEACDGIAVLKTVDPKKGIVMLQVPPGCESEVEIVLKDLKEQILLEEVFAL